MSGMLGRATRRGALAQIRHITPVQPKGAPGAVARVYAQVERDFGMLAPPVSLHSPAAEPLAACWLMLRETLLGELADRAAKEAVAAAVSHGNTCPYCVQIHATLLYGLASGRDAAAIAAGRIESITDPRVREIAMWARASGTRGTAERQPPLPPGQAPELIGVAVTFHYLNRMVNVFLGDPPIPSGLPGAVRHGLMRMLGRLLRPTTARRLEPGASLDLLPAAPLPDDLSWAAGAPTVADAFARAAAAIEEAGRRSVPEPVRLLVTAELSTWDGRPPGLDRGWVETAVSSLADAERPAGRLALLTALASYRIGQSDIDAFQRTRPGDQALIELTSWASLTAARRVAGWIGTGTASARSSPS